MGADEVTPITLPGHTRAGSTNGVVVERIESETTNEIIQAVRDGDASDDLMSALLEKAVASFVASGGKPGGGDNGAKVLKDIKRHKWIAALMALVIGPGGMLGAYYAIRDRSVANAAQVEVLYKDVEAAKPIMHKNTDEIRLIKVDVSGINTAVTGMKLQQTAIVNGIDSLKQVNVDRLEKENDKLEREIRRLERNR